MYPNVRVLERPLAHAATIALLVFLSATPAVAQFTPAWTWNRHDIFVWTTGAVTTTRGIEFTVSEPITVTALGAYDEEVFAPLPGLAAQHEMALWDVGNTAAPIVTAVVDAGVATPLCQDGYRYAPILATTLVPGPHYVLAAYWPGQPLDGYPDPHNSEAPVSDDPRITRIQERHKLFGGPFEFPNEITGMGTFYIGMMNLRIDAGECDPNPPADLATIFQGGNGQAGNMFDLKATHPDGLTVTGWQINLNDEVTNDTPIEVSIYWRDGSFVGHTSSADGWNLLGTSDVLSWGPNHATPVPLGGLELPFNQTTGVFITTGFITSMPPPLSPPYLNYSNMPPAGSLYGNADLQITGGVGKANPLFTGTTFANKMWNGGVLYTVGAGTSEVDIVSANPPLDNPFVPGVQPFRDVLQTGTTPALTQGIGAAGTPAEDSIAYAPISVTFSDAPTPAPAPDNVTLCCTGAEPLVCPTITGLTGSGAGPYSISLSGPIPPGACTTLEFAGTNPGQELQYQYLPGDVNLSGSTTPLDVQTMVSSFASGAAALPANLARFNINRVGGVTNSDVLRLVGLLNGVNTSQAWTGVTVAECPTACP